MDWKCVEVGNWYSSFKCTECGKVVTIDDDAGYSIEDIECNCPLEE